MVEGVGEGEWDGGGREVGGSGMVEEGRWGGVPGSRARRPNGDVTRSFTITLH